MHTTEFIIQRMHPFTHSCMFTLVYTQESMDTWSDILATHGIIFYPHHISFQYTDH